MITDAMRGGFGPNVERIRKQGELVVRGSIPAGVRRELMDAVKKRQLGRLKKDGLKPEIFFHPDHLHGARRRQISEAEYAGRCIAGVVALSDPLEEYREIERDRAASLAKRAALASAPPSPEKPSGVGVPKKETA